MTARVWIAAVALGVLLATGGVVALARVLSGGGAGGAGGSLPPCATSASSETGRNAAGPTASPATDDYWTPERMRDAEGAVHGEEAGGSTSTGPTPTCR